AAEERDDLIRARVVTTTRAGDAWPAAFGHGRLASATRARLTHPCDPLVSRGQSSRQRARPASLTRPTSTAAVRELAPPNPKAGRGPGRPTSPGVPVLVTAP